MAQAPHASACARDTGTATGHTGEPTTRGDGKMGGGPTGDADRRGLSGGGLGSLPATDSAGRFAACLTRNVLQNLPPTVLMCGSKDVTVPWHESIEYYRVLCGAGVRARSLLYDDVDHAGFVMSWRPLSSNRRHGTEDFENGPKFMRDLVQIILGKACV